MGLVGDATAIRDGGNGGSGGIGLVGDVSATAKLALATKKAVRMAKRNLEFMIAISLLSTHKDQPNPKVVECLQQKRHFFDLFCIF
jgi:hypothetical protein